MGEGALNRIWKVVNAFPNHLQRLRFIVEQAATLALGLPAREGFRPLDEAVFHNGVTGRSYIHL